MERCNARPGQRHESPGLVWMSVGCEDATDIWADLEQAL
jgi:cystathionine beta-lyase/cystathionine gamma-synthase